MKIKVQTDYALRTLMYLGYTGEIARAEDIASRYVISKDHLVKVIQQLAKLGFVRTKPGRNGGVGLARAPQDVAIVDVVRAFEGADGVLECVSHPESCLLEPGCRLRKALIRAEQAFYESLSPLSLADLCDKRQRGGIVHLKVP